MESKIHVTFGAVIFLKYIQNVQQQFDGQTVFMLDFHVFLNLNLQSSIYF